MSDDMPMSSVVVATKEQISTDLGGEVVILALQSGRYHSLNDVGSLIWNLVQEPKTVLEIRDAILDQYEVEVERCQQDILTLIRNLLAESLVEIKIGLK
jgi:hypothetical protein